MGGAVRLRDAKPAQAGSTPAPPSIPCEYVGKQTIFVASRKSSKEGGHPVKFARTVSGFAAVVSVGIVLALGCEHFAALLDAALAF